MTTSAPRSPNPNVDEGESSAQRKSTVIRLRIPPRRSTRLTPPTPIPTAAEVEEMIIQDTIQLSIAEQKSHDDLEAKQNEEKVKEHLIAEEIEKHVEGMENDESADDDYELRRIEKGKNVDESRHTPSPTTIRSPRIHSTLVSSDTEKLQELTETNPKSSSSTPSSSLPKPTLSIHLTTRFMPRKKFNVLAQHLQEVMEDSLPKMVDDRVKELTKTQMQFIDSSVRNYMSGHILHVHPTQASQASAQEQQYQLYLTMKDNPQLQHDDLPIWLALKIKFEGLHASNTPCRSFAIRPRDRDDPHDNAHPEGENSTKRQKTFEHGTYVFGESSSSQVNESEPGPSTSSNQEQLDDFDFWTDTYATDDDELTAEKLSQELMEEMSETLDEAKLRKVVDEMLRQ
ncbi:hypothetical protein Tco_0911203 [Tanacetum coccineum]|uniref:Uncharacterized protein n=1 Tax=Tanacetum coccineum TaxID=301880 RepID=A0ABQ5CY90_9ASTR